MKKSKITLLLIVLVLFFSSSTFSQGWYAGIGGGYGFPVAGISIYDETNNSSLYPTAPNSGSFTSKSLSYGKGVNFGIYAGYMFYKNMGTELGFSYLNGAQTTATYSDYNGYLTNTVTQTYSGTMIRFTPAIRLQTGDGRIRPYTVMGAIIGISPNATINGGNIYLPNIIIPGSENFTGGHSFGFHGALGVTIMCDENVFAFIEVSLNYQNYSPSMSTGSGQTINYVTSGNYSNSTVQPQLFLPFSSLGFNIGLHLSFAQKSKPAAKPASYTAPAPATPAK